MNSEEAVFSVLKMYEMNNPNIVLGYSDELLKLYKKDINSFLSINQKRIQKTDSSSDLHSGDAKVILLSSGNDTVHVIHAIRETLECGLKEAKDLVDNTPGVIKENIPIEKAQAIKTILEKLGATVEIKAAG